MTSYLTLLLATLGIMIGLFTVTGFINRTGGMLLVLRIFILVIITCKVEIYVNYWIIKGEIKGGSEHSALSHWFCDALLWC